MDTHKIYFALIAYTILIFTAFWICKLVKLDQQSNRFESLDGFRGMLAISVYIHHAVIWKEYINSGNWQAPKEIFYQHLGDTSVSFFFMITSFLFINKLIKDSKNKDFDAKTFFISRIFRIVPLYYFSVFVILIATLFATDFKIVSTYKDFIISGFHWITFNIFNKISFNQFFDSTIINAAVEWSLSYEWLFYFTIPLLSTIFVKSFKKKIFYSFISFSFIFLFFKFHYVQLSHLLSFVGGAFSPFIINFFPSTSKSIAKNKIVSLIIIILLIYLLNSNRTLVNFMVTSFIFTCIALGNTVFGILKLSVLKFLGEISYSTYLLHGIVLFVILYLMIGLENLTKYTNTEYCLIIFAISPLVLLISTFAYIFIENPFIKFGKTLIKNSKK